MLTTTSLRVIEPRDVAPNPDLERFLGHATRASWWLVGHWNGNHRRKVVCLRLRDRERRPTEADLERHFGAAYWRCVQARRHCLTLVWACDAQQALAIYRNTS